MKKKYHDSRQFIYPEAMSSEEQVQEHINRLTSWASTQYAAYLVLKMEMHEDRIKKFEEHHFKNRVKTNITVFHERAVKTLKQIINDKSKG